MFYGLESIDVKVLETKNDTAGSTTGPLQLEPRMVTVKYRLDFDNRDYVSVQKNYNYNTQHKSHYKCL